MSNDKILNETSSVAHRHHHKHKKHSKAPKKKTFKEKMNDLWKKFLKQLGGEGTKKETSMLLAVVMIMVLAVPVVIALLEFFDIYLRSF